ncbi:SirB2 family protein [Thalassotalea sediminis]|uniref:SirB2 family protein n=1 Tax=Thalassotalea sediminis TaxID=1759089 RepID=UPI002573C53F|nr:SirB2 family protein [Thalassotalea sediminis]
MFKHLHMTLAALSVALFTLRFIWTLLASKQLEKKWVKVAPHVIDTFLLLAGIALMVQVGWNPLDHTWLAEKLLAVVFYILTAYYTLKLARNRLMQVIGYIGALGWIVLVVRLALAKENIMF